MDLFFESLKTPDLFNGYCQGQKFKFRVNGWNQGQYILGWNF